MRFLLVGLLLLASLASAEIYTWTDGNGRVHYGDNPDKSVAAQEISIEVNSYKNVSYDFTPYVSEPRHKGQKSKVTMYSTVWCTYCKKARAYFIENNINFVEYDIEKDDKAKSRYDQLNATGVPVILVGKQRMNGFSEAGFERIYN